MSERLAYAEQLEAQISAAQAQLAQLKEQKKEVMIEAQHQEVENLEKYLSEAQVSLKGLSASGEDAWQALKEDADRLLTRISETLKRLVGK